MSVESTGKNLAVLMGDIINSREAVDPAALQAAFAAEIAALNAGHENRIVSPMTVTLGDEFQGLFAALSDGFTVLHALKLRLMRAGVACRFVLGEAEIETPINRERAWGMMGPGLADARAVLSEKSADTQYRFSLIRHPEIGALLDEIGYSLTEIEAGWSEVQARYVLSRFLEPEKTIAALAEENAVSQSNVYERLKDAKFKTYRRKLAAVANMLTYLDAQSSPGEG